MCIQFKMVPVFLPMDLAEDISANHLVSLVNDAVNHLDDRIFDQAYPVWGRDSTIRYSKSDPDITSMRMKEDQL